MRNALLGEAVERHGGRVVDTQGDSFFCVFPCVRDAAAAAAAGQQALAGHAWPQGVAVKVRMGIHVAEPELEDGRYVGLGVHRAARVGCAAHGGQVLLSNAGAGMLGDSRVVLRDLGGHALKDFDRPERLFQLQVDGMPAKFPPPRTGKPRRSRRRLVVLLAALAIGAAAIVVLLVLSGGSGGVDVGPTSLAVIDPKTNKVVDAIELGFKSHLIAAGEGYVWVADPDTSTLAKIDPRTRKIVRRTAIDPNGAPTGLAAGEGAAWIGVARRRSVLLMKFDPILGAPEGTVPLGPLPKGLLGGISEGVTVGGGFAWATDETELRVWRIDPATLHRHVQARGVNATEAVAYGAGAVWVGGSNRACSPGLVLAHAVSRVDAGTGAVTASGPLGVPGFAASVAFGQEAVWYASSGDTVAWHIDVANVQPGGTAPVGKGPTGVAVGEGAVWVASSGDATVSRVDPEGSRTVATIPLGSAGGVVARYGLVWVSPGQP